MKAYKYKLYPTQEQKEFFAKTFGCVRKVYNLMLSDRIKLYEENKESKKKIKRPTPAQYKEQYPFLKEVDSLALCNAQMNLDKAYTHFFRRLKEKKGLDSLGFPRYKSKNNPVQSYTTNNQFGSISVISGNGLKLPKTKSPVKIKLHRGFEGIIKSATISRTSSGKYYASLLVVDNKEVPVKKPIEKTKTIGIDVGIESFLTDSNGNKIENPKYLGKALSSLKKEQRLFSRKKKGSNNRNKQKIVLAKAHEKVASRREDFLHKVSYRLVYDNQVSSISIEDLNVKGMMKNRKLSKSIADCSWSRFVVFLSYKCQDVGKNLLQIDRFAPSSKTCNHCGYKSEKMPLKIRQWQCPDCKMDHDRDVNAAKNIRNFALADALASRVCVKSSPETKPISVGVSAKGIDGNRFGSHEAHPIALA